MNQLFTIMFSLAPLSCDVMPNGSRRSYTMTYPVLSRVKDFVVDGWSGKVEAKFGALSWTTRLLVC